MTSFLIERLAFRAKQYADAHRVPLVFAHGGARGVDELAEDMAETLHVESRKWLPDWEQHGKRAGILRNENMIDEFQPTIGIGLNWNNSAGTRHAVTHMKKKGIPMLSIEYTGDPEGNFFPF